MQMIFSNTVMIPYWTISVKWLGIERHDNPCGDDVTWEWLTTFADENGFWYKSLQIQLQGWYFLSMTFTYFGLFLSLTTVLDLYLVLRNPFANSEKRVKKFIFINFLTALFLGCLSLSLTKSK